MNTPTAGYPCRPSQDDRTAYAETDGADPGGIDLWVIGQPPERGLQSRDTVVVQVPGHRAREHPRHTYGVVAALEQVHAQRSIPFCGEPAADVPDVVVEPEGFMDDNDPQIWSRAVREGQI